MRHATSLAAESDDLGPWPGKREERIYTSVLSGQLRQSERLWHALTRGERPNGSRQLVRLRFRPTQARPQRIRSAVAVATNSLDCHLVLQSHLIPLTSDNLHQRSPMRMICWRHIVRCQ